MRAQLSKEQFIEIAGQFGTPVYVYHAEKITEQYQKLTSAFAESDVAIFYACKALTNINAELLRFFYLAEIDPVGSV